MKMIEVTKIIQASHLVIGEDGHPEMVTNGVKQRIYISAV